MRESEIKAKKVLVPVQLYVLRLYNYAKST
jgi:hypothetical protein